MIDAVIKKKSKLYNMKQLSAVKFQLTSKLRKRCSLLRNTGSQIRNTRKPLRYTRSQSHI